VEFWDEFLGLITDLFYEFQPRTHFEKSLVESMAAASWHLSSIRPIERR
jgi:hypothetical protein